MTVFDRLGHQRSGRSRESLLKVCVSDSTVWSLFPPDLEAQPSVKYSGIV